MHSVHVVKQNKWELVVAQGDEDLPGIRRFPVPGGWLYQVQRRAEVEDLDTITSVDWHAPVFVSLHTDGGIE
jgi:hypothetical protein